MAKNEIYQLTAERLNKYGLFSETTINIVASLAEKQSKYAHYQEFFDEAGSPEPFLHIMKKGNGVPVLDIPAKTKKVKNVIVVHLPMGNALDENQQYQVATIAAANSESRVIAFGNPSGKPHYYKQQKLTIAQRFNIAFTKNKQPLIQAELDYLKTQNIQQPYHVGYSFGALKALLACYYSSSNSVAGIVVIDPVAHARYLKQLVKNFQSTFQPLGEYVNRTKITSYFEARKVAYEKSSSTMRTLLRPINIAIAFALARTDFLLLFTDVLTRQPQAKAVVAWASESELGNDAHLKANLYNITHENKNVKAMRLVGDKHAVANDIHLYAAMVKEALDHL